MQHTELAASVKRLKEIRAKIATSERRIESQPDIGSVMVCCAIIRVCKRQEGELVNRIVDLAVEAFGGN